MRRAGEQRKLVGASLIKAVFERSAYGCKLYCCWCAQDPIAFRAGSTGKRRVHIFWQRWINDGDDVTPWWYPCQTNAGTIREDRLVLPIPPGTHWSDEMPVILTDAPALSDVEGQQPKLPGPKSRQRKTNVVAPKPALNVISEGGMRFGSASPMPPEAKPAKKPRERKPNVKNDPRLVTAARELRDRWLEQVNSGAFRLESRGRYAVARALPADGPTPAPTLLLPAA